MSKLSYFVFSVILSFSFSINYIDDIQPIFDASCTSCHSYGSPSHGNHQLILTSYSGLMLGGESGNVVVPYDASSSLLWQEVNMGAMPPYGSGSENLTLEQVNLIADWINDGALEEEMEEESDPDNWDCQYDSDCMDSEFCAVECFTGPCGLDQSETSGTLGQYCQPCDECQYPEDAVSENCDACETSDDGGDGAPECMLDCEGIETVDPEVDANAFCEWFMPTYDDTSCMDDCDYEYYAGVMNQIYSMCQLCLVDNSCNEMWNSENCSDLDEYECETSEDCEWNDYDMFCEDIEMNCADMGECECEFDFDCQWNEDDMMCEDSTNDGPPECWHDCEAVETLEDASGTEICNWFVPIFEDGMCFEDCHDCGPEEMIYDMCQICMQDDSCDDYFQDDESCSDLDQDSCEYNEDCQWNDYDMSCEDASGDDGGGDGPPECLEDCAGIENVNPEEDENAFCQWYIPVYDDGSCMDDCSSDYINEFDWMYLICQECLTAGDCTGAFDDSEDDGGGDDGGGDGGGLDNEIAIHDEYKISSVYPNPFNPTTTITYEIPEFSNISINVYNMNGQIVYNLYKGFKNPGEYSVTWNANNMTSGIYLIKLVSGSFTETQKVILIK